MADIPYNTDARGLLDSGQPNKEPYDHASPAIPLSPRPHRGDYHHAPPLVTYSPVSDAGKSSSHRGRFLKNGPYAIAVASMVGGIVAAAVVAIVHHAFGTHLRGRSVNERDSLWARYVVQLSNLLAATVAALLAVSFAASLLQIIWHRVAFHRFRLATLDRAFSIFTPLGLVRALLAFKSWRFLLPAIFVAALYQAAVAISIIAPSSIIPGIAPEETLNLTVSTFDMANFLATDASTYVLNSGDSTLSSTVIGPIMLQSMLSSYSLASPPPVGCGLSCKYTLRYYAPAMECREMARFEIFDGNRFGDPYSNITHPLYHANMWYGRNSTSSPSTNSLSLAYQTNFTTLSQPSDMYGFPLARDYLNVRGTACMFFYGTYDAHYVWQNNDYTIDLHVEKGKPLGNTHWMDRNKANSVDIDPGSWPPGVVDQLGKTNFVMNHVFVIEIFQNLLAGRIEQVIGSPDSPFSTVTYNRTQPLFTPLFKSQQRFDPGMTMVNFTTAFDDMPEAILNMFSYMTYALASANLSTVSVLVSNIPDASVWSYSAKQLWLVYGVGLAVASVIAIWGILCLHRNGFAGDNTFSHFLATTRQPQLESAVGNGNVWLEFGEKEFRLAR